MRDHLIAFIESVQAAAEAGARHELTLGSLFGTSAENEAAELRFGYGYHDPGKVVFRPGKGADPGNPSEELPTAEAVDKFLAAYGYGGRPCT